MAAWDSGVTLEGQHHAHRIRRLCVQPVRLHRSFLYTAFLYQDLRAAIRFEEGSHIIRHWKLWLPMFLGTKCHNYAYEAVNLIANLKADCDI